MTDGPRFYDHSPTEAIDDAIASYPQHVQQTAVGSQAPYDAASLAEIYSPRVRQLLDLRSEGFTHARWGYDPQAKVNRWFGVDSD